MPPILFIHGMWSRPSTFDALRAELLAAGIASHAPALPHHDIPLGASPPPGLGTLTLGDYVASLERAARALPEPPVIAGHSLGGLLAQLLGARVPHAGLVLLSPAPAAGTPALGLAPLRTLAGVTRRWGWWRAPTLIGEASARWGIFNGVPEAEVAAALAELTWDSGRVMAQLAAPFLDPARGATVDYPRLTRPALVLGGTADRITPIGVARAAARRLPGRVDYQELVGVGHWLFHDAVRPRIAAAIARFMASL